LKFYGKVFGWTFEDWSEYAGIPYVGAVTGDAKKPGINGALMQRQGASP
jgi:predicted enzyme related to lactoylglutathione lyase